MRMFHLARILLTSFLVLLVSLASAQLAPSRGINSIDLTVLHSKTVAIGTVSKDQKFSTLGSDPANDVRFSVMKTIKGDQSKELTIPFRMTDEQIELHRLKGTKFFLTVPQPSQQGNSMVVNLSNSKLNLSRLDFTLIQTGDDLIRYSEAILQDKLPENWKDTVELSPPNNEIGKNWSTAFVNNGYRILYVPITPRLEAYALNLIASKGLKNRIEGLRRLRNFRSDSNIAVMKGLLQDPEFTESVKAEDNFGFSRGTYPIRWEAFQNLRQWNVDTPSMESAVEVSRLSSLESAMVTGTPTDEQLRHFLRAPRLSNLEFGLSKISPSQIEILGSIQSLTSLKLPVFCCNDASLAMLTKLTKLTTLKLDQNPITDLGLELLAAVSNLKEVSLN